MNPIRTLAGLSLCLAVAVTGCTPFRPAAATTGIPSGYRLLHSQSFDDATALRQFVMTDPAAWEHGTGTAGGALELARKSNYQPAVRSPLNIALIADRQFGDFVLEADLCSTTREYGHRDMCLFFGVQEPQRFYYVHIASAADPNAHNVFRVNDAPRTNIAWHVTGGVNWGATNQWHKVRIERRLETGSIRVFFDDMTTPVMTAEDRTFEWGHIGFGSFDDTGKIDNIRVWGPAVKKARSELFSRP